MGKFYKKYDQFLYILASPLMIVKVFGCNLDIIVHRELSNGSNCYVPKVIKRCIDAMRAKKCVEDEGIFRLSGNIALKEEIMDILDWEDSDLDLSVYDTNSLASVLKEYLRSLPLGIVGNKANLAQLLKERDTEKRIVLMREEIQENCTRARKCSLYYLFKLLRYLYLLNLC